MASWRVGCLAEILMDFFGPRKVGVEEPTQSNSNGVAKEDFRHLRVCWPAREPRPGKSPKVLPECSRECSQKSGCSWECSRECSRGCSSCCPVQWEDPREHFREHSREHPDFWEHSWEHSGSTFRDFPALGSLAGQQTRNPTHKSAIILCVFVSFGGFGGRGCGDSCICESASFLGWYDGGATVPADATILRKQFPEIFFLWGEFGGAAPLKSLGNKGFFKDLRVKTSLFSQNCYFREIDLK